MKMICALIYMHNIFYKSLSICGFFMDRAPPPRANISNIVSKCKPISGCKWRYEKIQNVI